MMSRVSPTAVPAAPADPLNAAVAELAGKLRQDPVQVEQLMGNGYTAEVTAALREKAEKVDVPVFVALVETPAGVDAEGVDEELATLLHAELDTDGVYVVATSQGIGDVQVFGDLWDGVTDDSVTLSVAASEASSQVYRATENEFENADDTDQSPAQASTGPSDSAAVKAAIALDTAAVDAPADAATSGWRPELSASDLEAYAEQPWTTQQHYFVDSEDRLNEGSFPVVAAVCALVVVAAVTQRAWLLWNTTRRRGKRIEVPRIRELAEREVTALADELAAADPTDSTDSRVDMTEAIGCREAAERLLAGTQATEDSERSGDSVDSGRLLDVVGALVLGRTGRAALKGRTYRPCLVNPLHGPATTQADLTGATGATGTTASGVPTCASCAAALRTERPLDFLAERSGGGKPYYTGSSVYAETGFGALESGWWRRVGARGAQR